MDAKREQFRERTTREQRERAREQASVVAGTTLDGCDGRRVALELEVPREAVKAGREWKLGDFVPVLAEEVERVVLARRAQRWGDEAQAWQKGAGAVPDFEGLRSWLDPMAGRRTLAEVGADCLRQWRGSKVEVLGKERGGFPEVVGQGRGLGVEVMDVWMLREEDRAGQVRALLVVACDADQSLGEAVRGGVKALEQELGGALARSGTAVAKDIAGYLEGLGIEQSKEAAKKWREWAVEREQKGAKAMAEFRGKRDRDGGRER